MLEAWIFASHAEKSSIESQNMKKLCKAVIEHVLAQETVKGNATQRRFVSQQQFIAKDDIGI